MSLAITNRGTGGNNTGGTSFTAQPASTLAAGSMGVFAISVDNAGTSGNTPIGPATITDSKGNTWTKRQDVFNDPGAANVGVEAIVYTAPITVALLSSDTIVVNWTSSTAAAKAWTLTEISCSAGNTVAFVTSGVGSPLTSTSAQMTTGTIDVGHAVVVMFAVEAGTTLNFTEDSDTTNGSWSASQQAKIGTTTAGQDCISQAKIVTATATQSYDVALSISSDLIGVWAEIRENVMAIPHTFPYLPLIPQ